MDVDLRVCNKAGVSAAIVHAVIKEACDERGVMFLGHPFVRLSITDINAMVPFYSRKTVSRAISKLEDNNLIETRTFIGTTRWRRVL